MEASAPSTEASTTSKYPNFEVVEASITLMEASTNFHEKVTIYSRRSPKQLTLNKLKMQPDEQSRGLGMKKQQFFIPELNFRRFGYKYSSHSESIW